MAQNPLEEILNVIGETLNVFWEKKDGELVERRPKGTKSYLNYLAQYVLMFQEALDIALREEGIDPKDLEKTIANPPDTLSPKDKELILKCRKMKRDLGAIINVIEQSLNKSTKDVKKKPTAIFKKDEIAKDAQKPLQIGFKKGWRRL